jgi:hypothetical protein
MSLSTFLVVAAIVAIYGIYFWREARARGRFGYGETPQEAHDWFAGTVCHCYTDGTRVWFDKDGKVTSFDCGDRPLFEHADSDVDDERLM